MTQMPPRPSHIVPILATIVLLPLWIGCTAFADRIAPQIATIAEAVEVGLGLDVLPGQEKSPAGANR